MSGADFVSVGGDGVDLTSIKVGGDAYNAGDSFDEVEIQILKFDGTSDATYLWIDIEGDYAAGWYDGDFEPIEEGMVFLDPAKGLWIQGLDGVNVQIPALTL